jgi:hypothetical protein
MARLFVNREVLRRAKKVVVEAKKVEVPVQSLLPVCSLYYPAHGTGEPSHRYVRVVEANDTHVKGFEIPSEFNEEPGKFRSYRLDKIEGGQVVLLHLSKPVK